MIGDIARVVLIALALSALPASAGPQSDQRSYCAGIYQNYESQLRCVTRENADRDRIYRRDGSFNAQIDADVWNYCAGVFESWESVERCLAREEQAKRQLRR